MSDVIVFKHERDEFLTITLFINYARSRWKTFIFIFITICKDTQQKINKFLENKLYYSQISKAKQQTIMNHLGNINIMKCHMEFEQSVHMSIYSAFPTSFEISLVENKPIYHYFCFFGKTIFFFKKFPELLDRIVCI